MPPRQTGDRNVFWNNEAVGVNGTSQAVELSRGVERIALHVTVAGATTIKLQASHTGDVTPEGILPDSNTGVWGDVQYTNIPMSWSLAAGSHVLIVPDLPVRWVRLHSSAATTITAGFEAMGD